MALSEDMPGSIFDVLAPVAEEARLPDRAISLHRQIEVGTVPVDEKLVELARANGLEYVVLEDVNRDVAVFSRAEWRDEEVRRFHIAEAQKQLSLDAELMERFLRAIELAFAEQDVERSQMLLGEAREMMNGLGYPVLVADELEHLFGLLERAACEGFGTDLLEQIRSGSTLAAYRYKVEHAKGTYCALAISPKNIGAMLGHRDSLPLFFDAHGNELTFVDYGCGPGEMLMRLRKEKGSVLLGTDVLKDVLGDFFTEDLQREISNEILQAMILRINLKLHKNLGFYVDLPPLCDPHLIGLDQINVQKRLRREGVTGRRADLTANFQNFCRHSGLGENRVHRGASILTVDRVPDVDQMLENMVRSCVNGAEILLGTKGIIEGRSDGRGSENAKITYSQQDWGRTRNQCIQNLFTKLRSHRLVPQRISWQPYWVISSDCKPKGQGAKPQIYKLVLIGCVVEK